VDWWIGGRFVAGTDGGIYDLRYTIYEGTGPRGRAWTMWTEWTTWTDGTDRTDGTNGTDAEGARGAGRFSARARKTARGARALPGL
jgi:hypothetical protein